MRTFMAYSSIGVSQTELTVRLSIIQKTLGEQGVVAYCTALDEGFPREAFSNRNMLLQHSFPKILGSDFLFVIQMVEEKGENMMMEVGACLISRIPILVAAKTGLKDSRLLDAADAVWRWQDIDDLKRMIRRTIFSSMFPQRVP